MTILESYRAFKARPDQPTSELDRYGIKWPRLATAIVLRSGRLKECQTDADLDAAIELDRSKDKQGLDGWRKLQRSLQEVVGLTMSPVERDKKARAANAEFAARTARARPAPLVAKERTERGRGRDFK